MKIVCMQIHADINETVEARARRERRRRRGERRGAWRRGVRSGTSCRCREVVGVGGRSSIEGV